MPVEPRPSKTRMIRNLGLLPVLGLCALLGAGPVLAAEQPVKLLDLTTTAPAAWVARTPTSDMRVAEFTVPAADGSAGEVAVVVFHFGVGQGGSVEANVARWVSQFSNPDGRPVQPSIEPLKGALPATLVELRGTYARGVGMGPGTAALPDQMLLAAVIETPQGNLYPQMHGPAAQVLAEKPAFVAFIQGIRPVAGGDKP